MRIPQTETEFRNALVDAAELGAKKALEAIGQLKPYMTLAEANRLYGRHTVRKWIKECLVTPAKMGEGIQSPVHIDRLQIESVAKSAKYGIFYRNHINNNNQ